VNYLCRELLRDHAFRAAMKADPAAALAKHDLTEEERRRARGLTWPSSIAWGERVPHGLSAAFRGVRAHHADLQ
jgi:Aromatic-ring-opening dioxygenase LigAB, LigA subunit.